VSKLKNRNRKVKLTPKAETADVADSVNEPVAEVEIAIEAATEVVAADEVTKEPTEVVAVQKPAVVIEKPVRVVEVSKPITFETKPAKPIKLDFKIDVDVARRALAEVTDKSHIGSHVETLPTSEHTAVVTFVSTMPGYKNWKWLVMLSWLDASNLTIDEVAMVPSDDALIAPAWVPWSQRVEAGDLGIGDELPYKANDPALTPGYVEANVDVLDDQDTLRPFWWSLGLGRERVLSPTGRELAATRWSDGEYSGGAIMAKVAQGKCITCGFFNPLAGSLGSAFGACTSAVSPADGKVVAANFGCGAHSETDVSEVSVPSLDLVYDDTYDQGLSVADDVDNDDELDN
jgi:hypothetical protein